MNVELPVEGQGRKNFHNGKDKVQSDEYEGQGESGQQEVQAPTLKPFKTTLKIGVNKEADDLLKEIDRLYGSDPRHTFIGRQKIEFVEIDTDDNTGFNQLDGVLQQKGKEIAAPKQFWGALASLAITWAPKIISVGKEIFADYNQKKGFAPNAGGIPRSYLVAVFKDDKDLLNRLQLDKSGRRTQGSLIEEPNGYMTVRVMLYEPGRDYDYVMTSRNYVCDQDLGLPICKMPSLVDEVVSLVEKINENANMTKPIESEKVVKLAIHHSDPLWREVHPYFEEFRQDGVLKSRYRTMLRGYIVEFVFKGEECDKVLTSNLREIEIEEERWEGRKQAGAAKSFEAQNMVFARSGAVAAALAIVGNFIASPMQTSQEGKPK